MNLLSLVASFNLIASTQSDVVQFVSLPGYKSKTICVSSLQEDIRVGDIILVRSSNVDLQSEISHHIILKNDKKTQSFDQQEFIDKVNQIVRDRSKKSPIKVEFDLAQTFQIKKCSSGSSLYAINLIQEAVTKKCAECAVSRVEIQDHQVVSENIVSARLVGRDQGQAQLLLKNNVTTDLGPLQVWVQVPIWTTSATIRRGEILNRENMSLVDTVIPLSQLNYQLQSHFDLNAFQAQTTLPANYALRIQDIKKAHLIKSGQTVKGVIKGQSFEIESTYLAKASGARHEIIQVTNPTTKKVLSARVLDAGQVEIVE